MDYPERCIRAAYDDNTIRVYQAYSNQIANSALRNGTFVCPPFKMTRMTWIKPSFFWMMYRAGWGEKDAGQKRILGIDITREGFEWAIAHSCLSTHDKSPDWEEKKASSPVRIQWDPERDVCLNRLEYRSIQIGLEGEAVERYVQEWVVRITDLTALAGEIKQHVDRGELDAARALAPVERVYPLPEALGRRIKLSDA